jgi:ATP-dependent DNA ligase
MSPKIESLLVDLDQLGSEVQATLKSPLRGSQFSARGGIGLEGIVSKPIDAPYRSSPSKVWVKVNNPAAMRCTAGARRSGVNVQAVVKTESTR